MQRLILIGGALWLVLITSAPQSAAQTDNRTTVGINLWFHTDYNNSFVFTDIVRRARDWGSVERPHDPTGVRVDRLGWPRQDAGLFLHTSQEDNAAGQLVPGPAPLPAGDYRIVFNGRAEAIIPSVGTIRNLRYDGTLNTSRAIWRLRAADRRHENTTMVFTGTRRTANAARNTGLTNLRIFLPGIPDDGSITFNPSFLNLVRQFGIIRFMETIDANKNPLRDFADRVTPAHASYNLMVNSDDLPDFDFTGPLRGIAIEHMVQLCNETDADMWLNIPARATDDCVRQMLKLIRDGASGFAGLEAGRKLYLEYGNEIWNSFAPQAGFLGFLRVSALTRAALQRERATGVRHPINFDGHFDGFRPEILTAAGHTLTGEEPSVAATMRHRFVAFRIKTISDMARQVFGDSQMQRRIRPILASQFGDGQLTFSTGLRFLREFCGVARNNTYPANRTARRADEIIFGGGGASYAVGDISSRDAYFRTLPNAEFTRLARIDAVLARGYGIRYVAYEGGPSLGDPVTGAGRLDVTTERAFHRDSRMREATVRTHNRWMQAGGNIFVYFVLTGDPTFEFAGHDSDVSSQKMRAVRQIRRNAPPPVTTGTVVPTTFVAGQAPDIYDEGNSIINAGASVLLNARSYVGRSQLFVPVRTADNKPADVAIAVETSGEGRSDSRFEVILNGRSLGEIRVPANSRVGFRVPAATQGSAKLQRGLNVVTLRAIGGQTDVRRIRVRTRT